MRHPNPSPLERAQTLFRYQVMFRCTQAATMTRYIKGVMKGMTFPDEIVVILDVDPFQIC